MEAPPKRKEDLRASSSEVNISAEMQERLGGLLNFHKEKPMIPRVPASLRSKKDNKGCYEPQAASIATYDRMEPPPQRKREDLKMPMASDFPRRKLKVTHSEEKEENISAKMQEWLERLLNFHKGRPMIPRVPASLRSNKDNEECYEPQVVSIGPYHHRKRHLQRIELLRRIMIKELIRNEFGASSNIESEIPRTSDSPMMLRELLVKVREVVRVERKNWYAEDAAVDKGTMGDMQFARMMLFDGRFVLQFMSCCMENRFQFGGVEMTESEVEQVQRDLVLLENQLPFKVLEALEDDRSALFLKFAHFAFRVSGLPIPKKFQQVPKEVDPIHSRHFRRTSRVSGPIDDFRRRMFGTLKKESELDYLHRYMLEKAEKGPEPKHFLHYLHMFRFNLADFNATQNLEIRKYNFPSIKELKNAGIDFQPSPSWFFSGLRFSHRLLGVTAKLELPEMHVNELTKPILLNLAAYEKTAPPGEAPMASSFICFMDKLIDDEEDVKELRSNGVLYNALESDQTVAELFKKMGKDLVADPQLYEARVIPQIHNYFNHGWRIWVFNNLYHPYFRSPWFVPTLIVAIVGLGWTIIQTYFSIHSSNNL